LLLLIGLVQSRAFKKDAKGFLKAVEQESKQAGTPLPPTTTPPVAGAVPAVSNTLTTTTASLTNAAPAPTAPK
jgi:hypothetical protein